MGLRADSARPQRVSGSARTDSRRTEPARNPIAAHAKFGDDSALNAFTRTQWTAAFSEPIERVASILIRQSNLDRRNERMEYASRLTVNASCLLASKSLTVKLYKRFT